MMNDTNALAHKLRRHVVMMTSRGGSSHVASGLSIADIMAVLYGGVLRVRPEEPRWADRDRFILSKGHAGACLYAALAERGFFPISDLELHYKNGSVYSGHVSHKGIAGVELSTGSLGHGLGVACGMALDGKLKRKSYRVFALLSDGECDEGSNWEAFLFAAHHKLNNLVAIIDYNNLQSLKSISETLELEPLADKLTAFNWRVLDVDGHDHLALSRALADSQSTIDKPTVIIARTIKGKGISFMEHQVLWHYRTARNTELERALAELDASSNPSSS